MCEEISLFLAPSCSIPPRTWTNPLSSESTPCVLPAHQSLSSPWPLRDPPSASPVGESGAHCSGEGPAPPPRESLPLGPAASSSHGCPGTCHVGTCFPAPRPDSTYKKLAHCRVHAPAEVHQSKQNRTSRDPNPAPVLGPLLGTGRHAMPTQRPPPDRSPYLPSFPKFLLSWYFNIVLKISLNIVSRERSFHFMSLEEYYRL